MDLAYTAEQELFRRSVRDLVSDRVSPERLAEVADGPDGWDPALWKEAAGLGLAAVSVPEDLGGAGLGFVEEAIVAEELGRGVAPVPWLGTVILAQPLLAADPELLRAVASGDRVATVVGLGGGLHGDGSSITGRADHVVDLGAADLLVAVTPDGVFAVDRDDTDWHVLPTIDGTRRLGRVALEGAPSRRVGPGGGGAGVRTRALAAVAAEAVGVGSRAIEIAVAYAKERQQFGRAIGTYQAISHQLADAYMDTENARSLAMWAAGAVDGGDEDAGIAAATAKAFAAEAAVRGCERAIQVHGGIGFTWEHVLHRYYKRARWILPFLGSPTDLRAETAGRILG